MALEDEFPGMVRRVPENAALLDFLPKLNLPECYLTAGCLFQPVWNHLSGRDPGQGIQDFDVFYFDDTDLSWEAEDRVIREVRALAGDFGARVDVKNQARVHLWYEQRFGRPIEPLASATDGICRYPVRCTCVGIRVEDQSLFIPNGLSDVWQGRLEINPQNPDSDIFLKKARGYQKRWPWLTII